MTRKPISTSKTLDGDLCAVCDDGTIWVFTKNSREPLPTWKRFPDVPQPTEYKWHEYEWHETNPTPTTGLKNKPCQECGGLIVSREFNKSTCVNGHEFLTDLADIPTSEVLLNAAKWTLGKHPSQRKPK